MEKKPLNLKKKLIKCKHAFAVNSCTSGINTALHAMELKKGDEVLTSSMTFVSTINNLYLYDLKIKLIDINIKDYNIDVTKLIKNITKKTKLILITHYGGSPVDMRKIYTVCKKKKIKLIEDCATAFGAKIKNNYVGSFNHSISVFSFYANKIITTGEGGAITTNNSIYAKKIKNLIYCGINKDPWNREEIKMNYQYDVLFPGFKYNFTDLQAAIGICQIKKLKKIIAKRKKVKNFYKKKLNILIKKNLIKFLETNKSVSSSEYIFTILLNPKKLKISRDDLIVMLKKYGVSTSVHYIPSNKLSFYENKFKKFKLPITNYVFSNIVSLPFHYDLKEKEISFICKKISEYLQKNIK